MTINPSDLQLLRLLQIISPSLPVGAYSYSEGIEYLCHAEIILTEADLCHWLRRELSEGFIVTEAAIVLRAHQAIVSGDKSALEYWNSWFSATRESEEVRLASWQMGQSLMKLWCQLPDGQLTCFASSNPSLRSTTRQEISGFLPQAKENSDGKGCNYAIAFGVVAASLEIDASNAISGYIYSWLSNLVSAAVRTIPLGQTTGQQIIFHLSKYILLSSQSALQRLDSELEWCGWGASLACAKHETQYSRLFRS